MRHNGGLVALCVVVFLACTPLPRHSEPDAAATVEVAAARAMLERPDIPRRDVVIEVAFAQPNAAPAHDTRPVSLRPEHRNRGLESALGAIGVRSSGQVRHCSGCPTNVAGVVLQLSDPIFSADSAFVTVTATYRTTGRFSYYETVRFTLRKRQAAWAVVKAEQLGVS